MNDQDAIIELANQYSDIATRCAEALNVIEQYAGFDGGHHKQWCLDQVLRTLLGCPTVTATATDYKGQTYTYETLGSNEAYEAWVRLYENPADYEPSDEERAFMVEGEKIYEWDTGIAP